MNATDQPDTRRGPERFTAPAVAAKKSSPFAILGATLALAVLLVGLPVGLWLWQGPPPVPTGLPSRADLTQPLTFDALIVVLLVVVWLAWLQFTVCVVVEAISLLRGGGLPRPVPLSGRSQALARALVGTVLVGASLIGSAGAASADDGGRPVQREATVAVHDATTEQQGRPMQQAAPADFTAPALYTETKQELSEAADALLGRKIVVVQAPEGRYHHNLWDIAEEHLGDGRRWKEIFELNKGRPQPDGGELVIGRLIQPGWVLVLPDDAVGADRVGQVQQRQHERGERGDRAPAADEAADQGGVEAVEARYDGLAGDLLGGGLLAATLAGALATERRRRRGADLSATEIETEVALLVGADLDRAERVDRALRRLVVSAKAEGVALPPVYAVTVDDDEIELRIAPAAPHPPAPWIALKDGRRWRLDRESAEADQGPLGNAPYPGLVCIGRDDDDADVLIDLEAVGGPASVSGADAVAREVVSALAVQLVTSPWSDDQRVHSYELSPVLADVSDGSFALVDDLSALVATFESDRPDRTGQDVLSGRVGRKPDLTPQYLMLGGIPDDELLDRLQPMIRTGDRGLGVVAVGKLPGTRWHLTVDESGHLALPLLDIAVTAVRLTERTAAQLAGLFAKAREQRSPAPDAGVVIPRAPRPGDDAHWASAAVRIGVLGPLEARVPGQMDQVRLGLATEVATYLALQTAPVHPNVLAASVWPRGVTAEVRDATIERVREWLGHATDGSYLLRENDEGRLFLADDVAVDWHAFCTLVQRSRGAAVRTESELLRRALQLIRGPFLAGRERGRYAWLARTRLDTSVADAVEAAAHRLVDLSTDDPDGAAGAARAGLRLVPHSQLLWRDLLRAEYDGPGGPGVAAAVDEMLVALSERGADLEAETEALVEELMPGSRPGGSLVG